MNIYMIRHGETDWNKSKKIQGSTDIELNENGINQAKMMKEKFENINFDICLCSPLKRALKTAEIITNDKCDVVIDATLIERGFGKYEGQNAKEANLDIFKIWNLLDNSAENGIEPLSDLLKRADSLVEKIKQEYSQYQNILIVSHGGFIKALYYSLNGYNENTDFLGFHLDNCELYRHQLPIKTKTHKV